MNCFIYYNQNEFYSKNSLLVYIYCYGKGVDLNCIWVLKLYSIKSSLSLENYSSFKDIALNLSFIWL